jgi:hypothetical protein
LIPQAVVLTALGVAALPLVIVAWFSGLVRGRLPVGVARFLAAFVRYQARVLAYGWLLLDAYPPFGFDNSYPVVVEIEPTRLHRVSVFLRGPLAFPAYVVMALLTYGMALAAIPIWLIVLVLGKMPRPLYQATASAIRYQARYTAYLFLLTSAYPRRLFGDRELELSKAAKSIVALFLVLGLASAVGERVLISRATSSSLANRVVGDYNQATTAAAKFEVAARQCQGRKHPLGCLQALTPGLIAALDRFSGQLRATRFPAGAQPDALRLEAATTRASKTLRQMATARTAVAFFSRTLDFTVAARRVDSRARRLVNDLS